MNGRTFSELELTPIDALPTEWRVARLNTLVAEQELYVERRVKRANFYSLRVGGRECGYVAIDGGQTLLEMYIDDAVMPYLGPIASPLLERGRFRRILAQSFDPTLMFVGGSTGLQPTTKALLYRDIVSGGFALRRDIATAEGSIADIEVLFKLGDDFFDSSEEIASYIAEGGLLVYRDDDEIVGAGVMKRVIETRTAVDIGMVVALQRRHQGIGTYIVQHLKNYCLSRGHIPICGCEIGNIASRRTLERAGFASLHQLVEFDALPYRDGR